MPWFLDSVDSEGTDGDVQASWLEKQRERTEDIALSAENKKLSAKLHALIEKLEGRKSDVKGEGAFGGKSGLKVDGKGIGMRVE